MKHVLMSTFSACVFFLAVPVAYSTSPEIIRQALTAGDFPTAFAHSEELATADGYALGAESLLSEIMLGQAEKNKKQAKRARKRAEAALELDPSHQNARLQYVVADGFVARETSDVSAWMKKIPQKTHMIIEDYRLDFPNDSRGNVLLGAWHLAIARKAGNENAQKWFGANIEEGREQYRSARKALPNDIIIGVNYAFALLALKDEDFAHKEEARQVLNEVIAAQSLDHIGRVLQNYARSALGIIDERDDAREYVGMFLDGKIPEISSEY